MDLEDIRKPAKFVYKIKPRIKNKWRHFIEGGDLIVLTQTPQYPSSFFYMLSETPCFQMPDACQVLF